jgi:hypothetical protein
MKGIYKEPEMEIVQFDKDMIIDTAGGETGQDEGDIGLKTISNLDDIE